MLNVDDIRVFIPSKDYQQSSAFYSDLGFRSETISNNLTVFEAGDCTFFLQRFYHQGLAENLMMQLCVSDIQQAYDVAQRCRYKSKISEIQSESWGKVFYLWGPAGELWHITQLNSV